MPGSRGTARTDCTWICSRVISKSLGSVKPSRMMLMTIFEPGLPRMRLTASVSCMSLVVMPSIFTMRSPGCSPTRWAGVPSMGVTTVRTSSRSVISMPRPPKLPLVSTCISRYISGSRNEECGSSPRSVPLMAA